MATVTESKRHLVITSSTYESSGDVTVGGDLFVNGAQTVVNTATLNVEDKNISLNYGGTEASSQGAGLTIVGSGATLLWDEANTRWALSDSLVVTDHVKMTSGNASGKFAVKSTDVHASYDFYNNGTTYLNNTLTVNGSVTGTQFKLNNNVTNTNADSFLVYSDGGSTAYGMTLWNTSGTSGEWATMIFGPNQASRRISFGKANGNFGTNHAGIDELAWLDLDNGNYFTDGNIYPGGSTTKYVSTGRIDNWQTAYTYSQVSHLPLAGGTITGDLTVQGINYGLYHADKISSSESGSSENYYHDHYGGVRHLSMFIKNAKSDIIRYRAIDNVEYWNGSSWQDGSSQLANVKYLLDGRQDTSWSIPETYYKFRFTVQPSTPWPTEAKIGTQTSWTGSNYPGHRVIIEEYDGTSWSTRVTAKFGGSNTTVETTDNNCDNWGINFYSTNRLHTGNGASTSYNSGQNTRITVDFYGWTPSSSSYVTIPLQNIFITSNFSGTENTDYTNLLDYDRNITVAGNIVMGAGKTVDGVDISALPTTFAPVNAEANPTNYLTDDAFDTGVGLYLTGGSYNAGSDTATTPLVIDEGDFIKTKDGDYLRNLIGKTTGDEIQIGQSGTSLIDTINFLPGSAGNSAVKINSNTVWNAGNDGSGSGLDADLLDGQHASAFQAAGSYAAASHNHDDRYFTETEVNDRFARKFTFDPGSGSGNRRYMRLFTVANFDASVVGKLSSAGDYGDSDRATYEIQIATRNNISFDVYQLSTDAVSDDYEFFYKTVGSTYEIWCRFGDYNKSQTFTRFSDYGTVTYNFDSSTQTTPESLTSVTKSNIYHEGHKPTLSELGAQASGNYITGSGSLSAQDLTDIGNLSGTNTGDQDLSGFLTSSSTQDKYLRSDEDDTIEGSLTIGDGTADTRLIIKRVDGTAADDIQFFNGTTRVGDIGTKDTTWLRINQQTAKNIFTPRYIRADGGFFVDSTSKGINGSGNFIGGTITGASDANVSNWDTAYEWGNHASAGYISNLDFSALLNKGSGTGNYSTSGYLEAGRGSGGVALTDNDGYGNANVTFNHVDGTPEQAGSSGRIVVTTDSTTAKMTFELKDSVSSGTAVDTPSVMELSTSGVYVLGVLNLGDIGDTTLSRHSSGNVSIEGNKIWHAGGLNFTLSNGLTHDTTTGRLHADINYISTSGTNNYIELGSNSVGTAIPTSARISYKYPSNDNIVHFGEVDDLPFAATSHTHSNYITSNASDNVTGHTEWQDNYHVRLGNSADMRLYHTNGNSYIDNNTGSLYIRANVAGDVGGDIHLRPHDNENGIIIRDDNSVELYYDNGIKAQTTISGMSVTGSLLVSSSVGNLDATNDIGQQLEKGDASTATLRCDADRWRVYMGGTSATGENLTVLQTGNVGIKDSTPSYRLDVSGTIRATGDVIAYSDERVKENIKTIDNSLEKVNKLRGVEFNKIGEDKKSIGVIAQEIEKVLPEVVRTDDEGMKSVAYGNVVGVLIEAIKELNKEVEELKNKLNNGN